MNYKHGATANGHPLPEYTAWANMLQRCHPSHPQHHRYFDRGIRVYRRWRSFQIFFEDMGFRPGPDWTLERVDNNKSYTPSNCIWATRRTQNRNRENGKLDARKVKAIRTCARTGVPQKDLARTYGVSAAMISHIVNHRKWR